MISKDNLKFYLDPVQDLTCSPERVYVTGTARESLEARLVGTIVPVKSMERYGRHYYFVTEDGDYVNGAPIATGTTDYSQTIVALVEEDVFILGRVWDRNGPVVTLENVVRSDGKTVPHSPAGIRRRVTDWMAAAPWARECMPTPGDSADVVALKLALAQAKHKERTAMRVILQESMERGWNDDLEELREDHNIPTPVFGAKVSGSVMMPVTSQRIVVSELPEVEQEAIRRISPNAAASNPRISMSVEFLIGTGANTREEFDAITVSTVSQFARRRFDRHDLAMGDYSLSPILRKVS